MGNPLDPVNLMSGFLKSTLDLEAPLVPGLAILGAAVVAALFLPDFGLPLGSLILNQIKHESYINLHMGPKKRAVSAMPMGT